MWVLVLVLGTTHTYTPHWLMLMGIAAVVVVVQVQQHVQQLAAAAGRQQTADRGSGQRGRGR
jgi:hypothetical protein